MPRLPKFMAIGSQALGPGDRALEEEFTVEARKLEYDCPPAPKPREKETPA